MESILSDEKFLGALTGMILQVLGVIVYFGPMLYTEYKESRCTLSSRQRMR